MKVQAEDYEEPELDRPPRKVRKSSSIHGKEEEEAKSLRELIYVRGSLSGTEPVLIDTGALKIELEGHCIDYLRGLRNILEGRQTYYTEEVLCEFRQGLAFLGRLRTYNKEQLSSVRAIERNSWLRAPKVIPYLVQKGEVISLLTREIRRFIENTSPLECELNPEQVSEALSLAEVLQSSFQRRKRGKQGLESNKNNDARIVSKAIIYARDIGLITILTRDGDIEGLRSVAQRVRGYNMGSSRLRVCYIGSGEHL